MRSLAVIVISLATTHPVCAQDEKIGDKTPKQWSVALKHSDARVRYAAVAGLYELGGDAAPLVKDLIPLLKDAHPAVRRATAMTLANCKADAVSAVPALVAGMKDTDPWVRQLACQAIVEIGATAAPSLLDLLKDKDAGTRYNVIVVIVNLELQSKEITGALTKAAKDSNASVRHAALYALSKVNAEDADILGLLAQALGDKDQNVRQGAAQLLIGKGRDATPILIKAAEDPMATARRFAVQTIASMSADEIDEPGILALRKGLADTDPQVRQIALMGLANFGPKARSLGGEAELFQAIAKLLQEKDGKLRQAGMHALGQIGTDSLGEVKLIAAQMKDGDAVLRTLTTQALAKVGSDNVEEDIRSLVQEQLLAALKDADRRVQFTAAQALFQAGVRAIEPLAKLVEEGKTTQRLWAAMILAEHGPLAEDAIPALQKMSRDLNPDMRRVAMQALQKIQQEK